VKIASAENVKWPMLAGIASDRAESPWKIKKIAIENAQWKLPRQKMAIDNPDWELI
jgi:hypothetical protein